MKKLLLLFILIVSITRINAQSHSCCKPGATGEFALLADKSDFRASHLAPEPIHFEATAGKMVTFKTGDGKEGSGFLVASEKASLNYLLVFHEWWGLTEHIKRETEELAKTLPGVNVIAVDLYDGKVATNADDAGKMMQAVNRERAEFIIKGVMDLAGKEAHIQTIGWCFGGGWSLQAALLAGNQSKGCVMYYGMPEKDSERLKNLNGPVLGIFALKDGWINKPMIETFEKQMAELKKPLTVKWYDAEHAFANPSNPKYDKQATEDAHQHAVNFLKGNF